jgi:hypothetical protein
MTTHLNPALPTSALAPSPCPCCGHRTMSGPEAWETCPVCFWQDTPDGEGNDEPLDRAQEAYKRIGACSARWADSVRKPAASEAPPTGWMTIAERRRAAREELPAMIERAFGAVRRDGGVSLHQMDVLDGYGGAAELARAERLDPEHRWQDVREDKLTSPMIGQSLVFLDAKGYRFYVPAYMRLVVRALGEAAPCVDGLWYSLRGDEYHQRHHYALLSEEQRRTIAQFLVVMQDCGDQDVRRDARECLASYWHAYV